MIVLRDVDQEGLIHDVSVDFGDDKAMEPNVNQRCDRQEVVLSEVQTGSEKAVKSLIFSPAIKGFMLTFSHLADTLIPSELYQDSSP